MARSPNQRSAAVILGILEECATTDGHPFRTSVLIQDLAKHELVSVTDGWVVTTEKGKSAIRTLKAVLKEPEQLRKRAGSAGIGVVSDEIERA